MRTMLAVMALFTFATSAHAGQVIDGVKYNFTGTDWADRDCNGDGNSWNCPLNGSDATGGPDGESDTGKH